MEILNVPLINITQYLPKSYFNHIERNDLNLKVSKESQNDSKYDWINNIKESVNKELDIYFDLLLLEHYFHLAKAFFDHYNLIIMFREKKLMTRNYF